MKTSISHVKIAWLLLVIAFVVILVLTQKSWKEYQKKNTYKADSYPLPRPDASKQHPSPTTGEQASSRDLFVDMFNTTTTRLEVLSRLVQESFHTVQYQPCDSAKVFICGLLPKGGTVGFGAVVRRFVFCHTIAYGLQRTLLITNSNFGSANHSWDKQRFQSLDRCAFRFDESDVIDLQDMRLWDDVSAMNNTPRVVRYAYKFHPNVHGPMPLFLPGTTPRRIAQLLHGIHSNPPLWFIGQSVAFALRLTPDFAAEVETLQKKIGFKSPVVGMHIRHGDKIYLGGRPTEAKYVPEYKFMEKTDLYFELYHPKVKVRNIYLATDDPYVMKNLTKTYPRYRFMSQVGVSERAQTYDRKVTYNDSALKAIIVDVLLLSRADAVVCTLTSNIGSIVHELRQAIYPTNQVDTLWSMDNMWHFVSPGFVDSGRVRLMARQDFGNLKVKGNPKRSAMFTFASYMSHRKADFITVLSTPFQHTDGRLVYKGQNQRSKERGLVRADLAMVMDTLVDYPEPSLSQKLHQLFPEK